MAFVISPAELRGGMAMEWIQLTLHTTVVIAIYMIALGLGLGFWSWLTPCNRGMYWWSDLRQAGTNLCYWLLSPILTRFAQIFLIALAVALLFGGSYRPG